MRTPDILNKIITVRKSRLDKEKAEVPLKRLVEEIENRPVAPSFRDAISRNGLSIIGEVKKASPSKGVIRVDFNPTDLAREYEPCVDALSVLTEQDFFLGHPGYLADIHRCVELPLLRKDFIIDSYQVHEARALGASCVLLIAAVLDGRELLELRQLAEELGMDALIEVHDEMEMDRALQSDARIIGINNRNLHSFEVDLETTCRLAAFLPTDILLVSESGINSGDDIKALGNRINAVLVGESFMRAPSIQKKAEELRRGYET